MSTPYSGYLFIYMAWYLNHYPDFPHSQRSAKVLRGWISGVRGWGEYPGYVGWWWISGGTSGNYLRYERVNIRGTRWGGDNPGYEGWFRGTRGDYLRYEGWLSAVRGVIICGTRGIQRCEFPGYWGIKISAVQECAHLGYEKYEGVNIRYESRHRGRRK